jgi:hypothetical protein
LKVPRLAFIVIGMGKGRKLDRWILKVLGADPTTGASSSRSDDATYEELLRQEEEHRQALEQELLDNQAEREQRAADAQLQRDLARIEAEARAEDYRRQRNLEMIEEVRRQNPDITSFSNDGGSFSFSWDLSGDQKVGGEVECRTCSTMTAVAAFCSHCGQAL